MPLTDRVLMGPGPCNPYPEALEALARPMLGTTNPMTLPISGTGSAGMEAAFVNLVRPGDPVVVGVNGVFGERMCDVASRGGAEVVRVEAPWGQSIDPDRLPGALSEVMDLR
jgi:alanine-glyoxylate transaminase / serine-glyoxylate transaminase / serine-pyruvate transaminase